MQLSFSFGVNQAPAPQPGRILWRGGGRGGAKKRQSAGANGAKNHQIGLFLVLDRTRKTRHIPARQFMTDATFGPFVFEMADMRLLRDRAEIRLRPQARRVLRVLLVHRGHTVGYDQMMAEAWEGTFVSRHTVDVTVAEVRKSLREFGRWITHRTKEGYSLDVPSSEELIRRGWHFWSRRTREGAERAIECFRQAADECPGDFQAYEGLSTCYLMLATFGMRAPLEVYPKFLEAHEQAVAAGGMTGELHCNRAHGLHLFERNVVEAEVEFRRAADAKPTFGATYVRTVMLYATLGRLDEALEMVRRGYRAEPLLPTLASIEVDLHVWRREFELATVLGAKAVELHPYLQVARAAYAQALQFSGRLDEALAQYRLTSVMCPDLPWLRALEGTCLATMGLERRATPILEGLEQLRQTEYVDAYYMAVFRSALGQRDKAFAELERACTENAAPLFALKVDPKLDTLRADRRVTSLFESLYNRVDKHARAEAGSPRIRRIGSGLRPT
jgi:DNA-binding winged helix-turn-helix (wHTH) protein